MNPYKAVLRIVRLGLLLVACALLPGVIRAAQNNKKPSPPPPIRPAAPSRPAPSARPVAPSRPAAPSRPVVPSRPIQPTGRPAGAQNIQRNTARPIQSGSNRPVQNNTIRPTQNSSNRPIQNTNRPTQSGSNRSIQNNTIRPMQNSSNRAIQSGMNRPVTNIRQVSITRADGSHVSANVVRQNGRVRSIQTPGMTINHGMRGERTIVSEHNGRTLVSTGHDRGYMQRPYLNRGGHEYYQRTYWDGHHSYTRVYREYYYHDVRYYSYAPVYYYQPVFYGWAYNPWAAPVYYGWGWGAAPWYGYYGYYFAPYPVYPTASLWLTDYLLAANLQAAYQAGAAAGASTVATTPISSDQGQGSGLAFVPLFAGGRTFAQGFSAAGSYNLADDRISLGAGATASFSFSVPPGQVQIVAYGIPTGGYVNNAPAEVSVNGVTDTMINQDLGGFGVTTPAQLLLWRKSFGAGDYVLTIRSGGFAANVYGLWIGTSSTGPQTTASMQSDSEPAQPSAGANSSAVALTPEVKQEIAQEVQQQLAAEQAAAANPQAAPSSAEVPPALDPRQTIFVVSSSLDVSADGQECGLTSGDVIDRLDDTPDANQDVRVRVRSSKRSDCAQGAKVLVPVQDLQEMHNHFREQIDSGLQALAAKGGTGGLPKAPDTRTSSGEVAPPQPDPNVDRSLQDQQHQADQTESQVGQQALDQQGGQGR